MFQGSMTALLTPFRDDEIQWKTMEEHIEWQIANGTQAVIPCGTTGESPTLEFDEHKRNIERTVAIVKGRIPVIAGTGFNNTKKTVEMTRFARVAGADAALVVAPYYNRPSQEGLFAHFYTIAQNVDLPMIIYNIPGRTGVDILPETMGRLATHPNIVGVKDATADLSRVKAQAQSCGADFIQLSGEDATIIDYLAQGGHGCISVTANIAPALCSALHKNWQDGRKAEAEDIGKKLMPLHDALFTETSPQPAKYALSKLGFGTDEMRLPLLPASEPARAAVDKAFVDVGIKTDLTYGERDTILHHHG